MGTSKKQRWKPLFGYSTNVHRGDTLAQIYRNLKRYTVPIKKRVFGPQPGGLELHISMSSARELRPKRAREAFGEFLAENDLTLFSVNAYPLKSFHTPRVKELVYAPSWAQSARARWTNVICEILADLLPQGVTGSVSTLGGAYRRKEHGPTTFRKLARNFLSTIDTLAELEATTGKRIVLAVEPEPETTFENATDVIEFFESYLVPETKSAWRRQRLRPSRLEERLRRYFTVNFDTCHFSVLFEDPVESLRHLDRAGIAVGKLHVTNALRLPNPQRARGGYEDLRGMHERRYFHQFCGRSRGGETVLRGLDLDRLPADPDELRPFDLAELRSHYHVPLYLRRFRRMRTTQDDTLAAIAEVKRKRTTEHLVIETYTWPLLEREEKLVGGIAKEFRWLLKALSESQHKRES